MGSPPAPSPMPTCEWQDGDVWLLQHGQEALSSTLGHHPPNGFKEPIISFHSNQMSPRAILKQLTLISFQSFYRETRLYIDRSALQTLEWGCSLPLPRSIYCRQDHPDPQVHTSGHTWDIAHLGSRITEVLWAQGWQNSLEREPRHSSLEVS